MTQSAPPLAVEVEDVGPCSKKLRITVPAERVDQEIDDTYKNVMKAVQFPGFRAGKAPRKLVEAKLGERVMDEVRQRLVESSVDEAVKDNELRVIGTADLDWKNIELARGSDLAFDITLDVHPEFEVPELKALEVERPVLEVTDESVEKALEGMRQERAKAEDAGDEPLEDGWAAELEVDVKVDDEAVVEGAETVWRHPSAVLGGMQIEGLADGMLGKKKGDEASFTQELPADFREESMRGKVANITLRVTGVERVTLPDLDDAFAQDMDYDDLGELRDETRRQLERRLESQKDTALDNAIVMSLIQATELELPPKLREQETVRTIRRYEARLREQGVDEEQIPGILQQAQENASGEVDYELRSSFIIDRIATERKVLVTETEVRQELANMAARYNRTAPEMEEYMERNDLMSSLRSTLRERKTLVELRDVVQIIEPNADSKSGKETDA